VRPRVAALALAGLLVLFGTGCGGIDTGKLESAIKSQTNDQLEHAGQSKHVSSVSCAKTTDSYHYTCDLKDDNGSTLLKVTADCTKDGTCRWKRSS
jgi:hypothetical protein